jgi:hypothetical protein
MECQVNVAQDNGDVIEDEYLGKKWRGWTDGIQIWKSFRIPRLANTDPEYSDTDLNFDTAHIEGIGMTGWDWVNRQSLWVAYDFDAMIGHSKKHDRRLTDVELENVVEAARNIPWVTLRRSTSGNGLHLYVFLDMEERVNNHNEHSALARSILGKMSALTGFNFATKVDICGGNMWVYHRKQRGTEGLTLIKEGTEKLRDIPPNWRDHIKVVTGKKQRASSEEKSFDAFEELTSRQTYTPLDETHKQLLNFLETNNCLWWWDTDRHMLVTHTTHLQDAHTELQLKGHFKTIATGSEKGMDHNCFCYPMPKGAWSVRRYSPGVSEDVSWDQDQNGWTRTYLNREPDLGSACRSFGGVEDPKGGFLFHEAESAVDAARVLGVTIDLPVSLGSRETRLKAHKDGRLVVEIRRESRDTALSGWISEKKDLFQRIYNAHLTQQETNIGNVDEIVRHLVTHDGGDSGWTIFAQGKWHDEPLAHINLGLRSEGHGDKEIKALLGSCVMNPWRLVNRPFQNEYLGDREWNRNAAAFAVIPTEERDNLRYDNWQLILEHCGQDLDPYVQANAWCNQHGIKRGSEYLVCWIASLFQDPLQPLPFLFFFGQQNSGKSIFHEALSLLLTKGYKRADVAITSTGSFNAELEGALICVIEETDLRLNKMAYNRIKDWVTSPEMLVHRKGDTPYLSKNSTHWIQCANDHRACPIFPGDTRITMINVPSLTTPIPKKQLIQNLRTEAPDFLAYILSVELPPANDRLNIPVIETSAKNSTSLANQDPLTRFITEECSLVNGCRVKFSDFYDKFLTYLSDDPEEQAKWTKRRVSKEMSPAIPRGRSTEDNQLYIGNLRFSDDDQPGNGCYKSIDGKLKLIGE